MVDAALLIASSNEDRNVCACADGLLFGLRQHAASCFIERCPQRGGAFCGLLLCLRQSLARDFRQFVAESVRCAGKRRFKFGVPLLRCDRGFCLSLLHRVGADGWAVSSRFLRH